jgi:chitodextrinase
MKLSKIYSENRLLILLVSVLIVLIGLPVIILLLINKNMTTAAAWYDTSWLHRKSVSVSNDSGSTLTNEDVLVSVDTQTLISEGKLQSACEDIRFVDSDDSTVLDYWIEGGCDTATTQVWVRIPSLPTDGKTIYMYYDNSSATSGEVSWTGNFISLSDQSSCGSGWSQFSALDGRFPIGSSTYGSTGGATTHSHTAPSGTTGTGSNSLVYTGWNVNVAPRHSHNISVTLTSNVNHMPQYTNMLYCSNSKVEDLSNNIALFDTSSVTGWTQYSALDDRFPLGATASIGTTGGNSTHTHTASWNISSVSNDGQCQSGGVSVNAGHGHSVSSNSVTSADNTPVYLAMVYMKMSSANTLSTERPIYILNTSTMPLGWERFNALDNSFPMGATSYGATGGSNTHTHTASLSTSWAGASGACASGGTKRVSTPHSHTGGITTDTANDLNLPPYLSVVFAKRKLSQTMVLGAEDSAAPLAPTAQTATADSTTDIIWNFTDNSTDEDGFKVYDISDTLKVTCALPNISSCLESTLSENTEYTRKFTAYNSLGESEFSATTSAYTKASSVDLTDIQSTATTVSMTSNTFANDTLSLSGYYFDCTSGGCDTGINEWIQTNTDEATGLDNNSTYKFTVKNRNGDGVENDYPINAQEIWTKAAVPTISEGDLTATTVVLNGAGVNNLTQGSSGLYFDCTVGELCDGGINEWVSSNTDTVTGLTPNTKYSFAVKARNYDSVETSYSSNTVSVYTDASQPSILSIYDAEVDRMSVIIENESNPSSTLYLLEEVNTAKYVNSSGQLVVDPQWLTYAELGEATGITVTGLDSNTEYSFRVKAKNSMDVETNFSDPYSMYTKLLSPTALTPETKTDSSITWKISTTEIGYDGIKIYNSSDKEVKICIGSDITECQETGLTPNTIYERKFTIYNMYGESEMTSPISEVTYAQGVSISLATPLNYYEASLSIDLGDNPVGTDLQIFEEVTSKYYDDTLGILLDGEQTFASTGESVTVSGLSPNTEYSFKVRTLNSENDPTSWSSVVAIRTYAQVPNIISSTALSTTSGRLVIHLQDNPVNTRISITETNGQYISESGTLIAVEDVFSLSGDSIDITGLSPNTTYTFKVRAYNEDDVPTDWSSLLDLTTLIQAPTISISNITNSSVQVTASGMNNIPNGDSGIYIERIGSWSKNLSQTVSNLNPNAQYTFRVRSRNSDGLTTAYVSSSSIYTLANTPSVSSVTKLSSNTARIYLDPNGNPSTTQFAIRDEISEQYINSNGNLQDNPVWQTYSQWGGSLGKYISGINDIRQLGFQVKARNYENIETGFGDAQYIGTGSVILNAPSTVSINLKDDGDVDLSSDPQLGIQDVRIEKEEYLLADLKVSFENDRDWEDIVVDSDIANSKTVVKVGEEHGITDPFTMYVVRNDTNSFRLCPQAISLSDVKAGCPEEQLLTKDFPQEIEIEGNIVTISEAKIDGVYYWIADGLTGTGGMGETVAEDITPIDGEEYDTNDNQESPTQEEDTIVSRVSKAVNNVTQNIVLGTTEIFDKTPISQLNEEELVTAVATTTTVTITVGIASTGLMQSFYLIFHFFNSIFNAIGFKGKRKPFGYVYDSVTKEPISNAVVRIYSKDKLVDTTVTNTDGMFLANLKEGKYNIKVKKGSYTFPSTLIKGSEDYPLKNVYKGEVLNNKEESDLIISIPLDKIEVSKQKKFFTSIKSLLSGVLTVGNILLFAFGILLIIYTYYQHPNSFNWYVILLYIPALYFLTKSIFGKTAIYGKVLDQNRKPVSGIDMYLVDKEFNEVVAKRITDKKGRYRFICKKGKYDLKVGKGIILSDIQVKKDGYILAKKVILN